MARAILEELEEYKTPAGAHVDRYQAGIEYIREHTLYQARTSNAKCQEVYRSSRKHRFKSRAFSTLSHNANKDSADRLQGIVFDRQKQVFSWEKPPGGLLKTAGGTTPP
jgi:hypothetical protein